MPSGKTHDAITFLMAAPVFAAGYVLSADVLTAAVAGASFLFGGLMFGPDLDTVSVQYSRWSLFRPLWLPYRMAFKHRSRWSHGLIFGTLFRVVYFMGAVTIAAFLVFLLGRCLTGGEMPNGAAFMSAWQTLGEATRLYLGESVLGAVFAGMWAGAASHTFTDMAGTYIKTGRVGEFF